jgi:hypothetical protein
MYRKRVGGASPQASPKLQQNLLRKITLVLHLDKIGDCGEHEILQQHLLQRQTTLDMFFAFLPRVGELHDQSLVLLVLCYTDKEILEAKQ